MAQPGERGFSIVEATIAVSLLAIGVAALAQLTIATGRANAAARRATIAQQAASERMEQLRALAWTSDGGVVPVTDWSSDLTTTPASTGGVGLASAPSTLATNTPVIAISWMRMVAGSPAALVVRPARRGFGGGR